MLRLCDEFRTTTEQLGELYEYRQFVDERINMLEFKLQELGEMIDFVDGLELLAQDE